MSQTTRDVTSKINSSIDTAVIRVDDNIYKARVCIVCDHILTEEETARITSNTLEKAQHLLSASGFANVNNQELIDSYAYTGKGKQAWMKKMLLSPRAHYIKPAKRGHKPAFTACQACQQCLSA